MKITKQPVPKAYINNYYSIAIMIALGAFMFSSKSILVKLLYTEGLTPTGVLAIRMGIALPFYIISLVRIRKSLFTTISQQDWGIMIALSFVGYFLCSWINFTGLQYISVGLERVIMFSYPSLVLLGSIIFQKQRPKNMLFIACFLSWTGLYLVLKDEIHISNNPHWVLIGSSMTLISATIYAAYILVAKPVIVRVGANTYTSITMCISCVFILIASLFSENHIESFELSSKVIIYGAAIAIFGTVLPTYILSYGLSKTKPASYAVISSIGPVATITLSIIIAGKQPNNTEILGIIMSVTGSLLASKK